MIEARLKYEPETEARNRKPLLREVEFDRREVQILAVGTKRDNRLFVGGEEIKP